MADPAVRPYNFRPSATPVVTNRHGDASGVRGTAGPSPAARRG
jgi:hypothetical protein